jgi:hypothetical protein
MIRGGSNGISAVRRLYFLSLHDQVVCRKNILFIGTSIYFRLKLSMVIASSGIISGDNDFFFGQLIALIKKVKGGITYIFPLDTNSSVA